MTVDTERNSGGSPTENEVLASRLMELEDREQIRNVLCRYCRALDRLDMELFRRVFWEDGGFGPGPVTSTARDFTEALLASMADKYAATHHQLGNVLIELAGSSASVETYATVYHRTLPTPDGNRKVLGGLWMTEGRIHEHAPHDFTAGVRYVDRFEKRRGEWRIGERTLIFDWTQVVASNSCGFGALGPGTIIGQRDQQDYSYNLRQR